jgi:hypothetical protein
MFPYCQKKKTSENPGSPPMEPPMKQKPDYQCGAFGPSYPYDVELQKVNSKGDVLGFPEKRERAFFSPLLSG